ncbi:MAG: glycoside hydrolase family 43 protein [Eubacterium sp.]|nr:glycoside hydrolase family 43 protein [Eubacterium sp.]
MKKTISILLSLILLISTLSQAFSASAEDAYSYLSSSRVSLHDPSIVRAQNGKYYSVGSHLAMAQSDDLINWHSLDSSMDAVNYLTLPNKTWKENLAEPLKWTTDYQRAVGVSEENIEYNCWANDIIYNKTMKKYCLYGCCSVWGTVISVIWLAVSDNIEGPYEYVDSFVYSGMTVYNKAKDKDYLSNESKEYARIMDYSNTNMQELVDKLYIKTSSLESTDYGDVYNFTDYNGYYLRFGAGEFPNAIDPTAFTDASGNMWLVYGSYSGGCYVLRLNNSTGLPFYLNMSITMRGSNIYFGKQISKTNAETEITGEGPFIVYDSISKYYYFFLTYGGLAANDGYNIREYRSKNPDGPYEDAAGNSALDMKNTGLKLMGNYQFDCQKTAYLSGGHSSCLVDSDGSMYQAYHTRFTADGGWGHQMRVHKMARTSDGWAVLLPFEYQGNVNQSVNNADIAGVYEYIDSTNITQRKESEASPYEDIILPKQYINLNSDGTISNIKDYSCSITNTNTGYEEVSGTWSYNGSSAYTQFRVGDVNYNGVFTYQKDESEQANTVLTFSLAGDDNSTIWGVKHSHSYIPETVLATPNEKGYTHNECKCGEYYNDAYTDYASDSSTLTAIINEAHTYSKAEYTAASLIALENTANSFLELANTNAPQYEYDSAVLEIMSAINELDSLSNYSLKSFNGIFATLENNNGSETQLRFIDFINGYCQVLDVVEDGVINAKDFAYLLKNKS